MRIDDILKAECILKDIEADTKEDALRCMAGKLHSLGFVKESFTQVILDREASYPSGLPMADLKIAIPHTDAVHVNQSAICFARLSRDVEFSVMGEPAIKIPVRLISMFALKEKKKIGDLLETLITTYQDTDVLRALAEAQSESEILTILRENVGKNLKES